MLTQRRLPSLNGLRAFEAAARSGSFARAAVDLSVTPAAVSRLVRLLEQRLDLALFLRQANRLELTPAGATYAAGLTRLFDDAEQLTANLLGERRAQIVTIGVGPSFAIRWLIPRLAQLHVQAPNLETRITTGGEASPFNESWTCGIRLGTGDWPGLFAVPLFAADLLPVCAPGLAVRITRIEDLAAQTLIRVGHAPEDWPLWLGDVAIRPNGPVFEFYGQALQAALDGLGVAMGVRPYIDDDLAAGRLVAPFPRAVSKGKAWYLLHQQRRERELGFMAFRRWIIAAAGQG